MEGDEISSIYFLTNGMASFVLPSYENTSYVNINNGNHFGVMDIIGSIVTNDNIDFKSWL